MCCLIHERASHSRKQCQTRTLSVKLLTCLVLIKHGICIPRRSALRHLTKAQGAALQQSSELGCIGFLINQPACCQQGRSALHDSLSQCTVQELACRSFPEAQHSCTGQRCSRGRDNQALAELLANQPNIAKTLKQAGRLSASVCMQILPRGAE